MPDWQHSVTVLLEAEHIRDLTARTKQDALGELAELLADDPRVLDLDAFKRALIAREEQQSTGMVHGIAIPHVRIADVTDYVMAIGRSREGIEFGCLDGKPVHLIIMIGASDRQTREFVRILAHVTHMLKDVATREALMTAEIPDGFRAVIEDYERARA